MSSTISALPAASALATVDLVPVVQGGVTERATMAQIATVVSANITAGAVVKSVAGLTDAVTAAGLRSALGLQAVATTGSYNSLADRPALATVATTGAYGDLSGRPTVPTVPSAGLVISTGSGFVAGTVTAPLILTGSTLSVDLDVASGVSSVAGNTGVVTAAEVAASLDGQTIAGGRFRNMSYPAVNKGTGTASSTQTFTVSAGAFQTLTVGGALSIATNGWSTAGLSELLIALTNGGAFIVTWPAIRWIKPDGSFTTVFADSGVTLRASGTDFIMLWSYDTGGTVWGKVVR